MSSHMSDLHPTRRIANIWSRGNKTSAKAVEVLGRVSWAGYQIDAIRAYLRKVIAIGVVHASWYWGRFCING